MPDPRLLPPDPLAFLQRCVRAGSILWTHHVNMRFGRRQVTRDMVVGAVDSFEVIEPYPDDKYLPSYLVRAEHEGIVFHVLLAADVAGSNVRVVTAYIPDPLKWEPGYWQRRQRT
jgi:hypothetical protein